jgi:hypothetical protein
VCDVARFEGSAESAATVRQKVVALLAALVEGTPPPRVVARVVAHFDLDALVKVIEEAARTRPRAAASMSPF